MKLQLLKTNIGLVVLCAAISTVPLAGSAQTAPGALSTEAATPEQRTHHDHRSNYGLIGLLGLLGLAGLRRRKQDVRPQERTDDRPPAAPGSYVSDLKTEKRTKPK
jgi:MYXO-CTERM domain-containing protein